MVSSPMTGQFRRPRSNLLKYSQNPSPSHSRIFILSRFRLQNTNKASEKGSREKNLFYPCHQPVYRFSHVCRSTAQIYRLFTKLNHSVLSTPQTLFNIFRSVFSFTVIWQPLISIDMLLSVYCGFSGFSLTHPLGTLFLNSSDIISSLQASALNFRCQ